MAVLASMSVIVIVSFGGQQRKARDARRRSDLKQYQIALEAFANKNNGLYPARSPAVQPSTLCTPTTLNISGCPNDPTGTNAYQYRTDGTSGSNNATTYVLWAALEYFRTGRETFVVCSDGRTGYINAAWATGGGATSCPAGLIIE